MFFPYAGMCLTMRDPDHPENFLVFPGDAHASWIELALYLGQDFRHAWMTAKDSLLTAEFASCGSHDAFYHHSERYLYHGIGYFLEGWKRIGYALLFQAAACRPGWPSILDYGCGVGSDGLWFEEGGYSVSFADLPCPAREFLTWRLAHRIQPKPSLIYDVTDAIPHHDLVWCMDVLEHLPPEEHRTLLTRLASLGHYVILNLVDDKQADGQVHYPVDVEGLTTFLRETTAHVVVADMHQKPDGSKVRFVACEVGE